MTDSENSQPQDDSDEDIYKDIPEFNFEEELAKLEGSKEIYKQEASDLTEKVKALTQENKELKKLNEVLKKNLSTLLKTAQAEVQRKDSVIEELRSKVESFTFRRNKKSTSDKFTSTDDLIPSLSLKQDSVKQKSSREKKRSKSYENWTSSDSEWRCSQDNEKKTVLQPGKQENSNCGEKKSDYQRGNAQNTNFRYSESSRDTRNEKRKERKSSRYEDSSDHRRPFQENHRDHLLYDSYDKKRHSRSSDNRFLSRRRSTRERRHDRRRSKSCERRKTSRRGDSSESSRRRDSKKEKSRSRESKELSLEKPKSRFSRDNEFIGKTKEGVEMKPEVSKDGDGIENKRRTESSEKKRNIEESVVGNGKNKQNKEKASGKNDKRKSLEIFNTKSPLDALYNDMVASRSLSQFSNSKESKGTVHSESGPEELFESGNEFQNRSPLKEDWTLSFKNERQNETKPMTLYSRRMMQKFSSESKEKQLKKNSEGKEAKEKIIQPTECKSTQQLIQTEKEPGELTDDESVIESSKEFQELTKVAALEGEIIKSPAAQYSKESLVVTSMMKIEPLPKDSQMELEKFIGDKEESATCKNIESEKDMGDVIEFSPFKNNYKLIEISPIKPAGNGHILDFYSNKVPPTNLPERPRDPWEEKTGIERGEVGKVPDTSGEEDSWKNSSSENNMGSELEIVTPSVRGSPKEEETLGRKEREPQRNDEKELTKKREKKLIVSKEKSSFRRGKRRSVLKKGTEKSVIGERTHKRKRKLDDEEEGKSDSKKLKLEKSELPRKNVRSKRNSKSGTESQHVQEAEIKPQLEVENRINEDTSSCEFFKPVAGTKVPEIPVDFAVNKCPATDYKIAASMSVTGVVRLETPNKCMGKLKNLTINEQMILNILDSKKNSQFSPLIGSKSIEMTPRRILKNDLMLTDSEDDSLNKRHVLGEGIDEVEERVEEEEEGEEEENESGLSGSECSDCGSDSGASNFVDLL